MKFLLIVLKIFYVLNPLLAPSPVNPIAAEGEEVDQNEVLELEKQRMIRRENETLLSHPQTGPRRNTCPRA
ncbi:hypothetical protein Tco_0062240, partial [Tanacetum coccineum]